MRQLAFHALAHGANGVLFFRWRTCTFGTEQYWHGILDHDGVPRQRYRELCRMGEELFLLGEGFEETRILPRIALVNDYDSRFALQIQPSSQGFSYAAHAARYFDALYNMGHPVSIVTPSDDLSPYSLVIVPALFVIDGDFAERLRRYVDEGGVAVATFRTGVKNRKNQVVQEPLPAFMNDLFGIQVHHYESLRPGEERELRSDYWNPTPTSSQDWKGKTWCDLIEPDKAERLASYAEGAYEDRVAISRHPFGKGTAYYIGTEPNPSLLSHILSELVQSASVPPGPILPEGIEMTCRQAGDERYIFLFNGCGEERSVPLSGSALDILSGEEVCDSIIMEPYGVAILRDIEA
jgi:beta-galactosidase